MFLVYSGSGCWTDYYELGMLRASADANPLKPGSWRKLDEPVFWQSAAAHAYGTGHNSFFRSPDGKQDWILYHANAGPGEGCGGDRAPRAQPFSWNPDGTPNFGRPVPLEQPIQRPEGDWEAAQHQAARRDYLPGVTGARIKGSPRPLTFPASAARAT